MNADTDVQMAGGKVASFLHNLVPFVSPEVLYTVAGALLLLTTSIKGETSMRVRHLLLCVVCIVCVLLAPATAQAQWSNLSLTLLDKPCRSVDTRLASGLLQDNEIFIFSVDPASSIFQGGTLNCGVPSNAAAVKLLAKGQSNTFDGGYFRIFRAGGSALGTYSMLQLQDPGQFVGAEFDIPIDVRLEVAIHTLKEAHVVVDISGYYIAADSN